MYTRYEADGYEFTSESSYYKYLHDSHPDNCYGWGSPHPSSYGAKEIDKLETTDNYHNTNNSNNSTYDYKQKDFSRNILPIEATIKKQTDKAYLVEFKNKDTAWVPKSVTEILNNKLYLQDWFFDKLVILKPVITELELSIFSKEEIATFDEPKLTYNEWLEEYKKRQVIEEQNNKALFQDSIQEIELDIFKKDIK